MDRIGNNLGRTMKDMNTAFRSCEGAPNTIQPGAVVKMAEELECVLEWATDEKEPLGQAEIDSIKKVLAAYYGGDYE